MRNLAQKRAQATKAGPAAQNHQRPAADTSLVGTLVDALANLGVRQSFGVSGGAIALLFDALSESRISLHHFRHETGAAFAATEAHFASGRPTVCFATTGPGALNALTGITAAKWDGAKVILLTGATSVAQRGRWATQETSPYTLPQDALYSKGAIFDFAVRMESASELPEVLRRLSQGLSRPGGFVAHVCLPMSLQASRLQAPAPCHFTAAKPTAQPSEVERIARLLKKEGFAIWAGFGATQASGLVRELSERASAKVFCSPRGKGIMPEDHANYLGVSGLGGHPEVTEYMVQNDPARVLVLGSRLGEATSFWDRDLVPRRGFVQVDFDADVPGTAYPDVETVAVHAEIKTFLEDLLEHFPKQGAVRAPLTSRRFGDRRRRDERREERGPVRPQVLMDVLQHKVVEDTEAIVLAECGNSFAWCNHHLRFDSAGRYRVSTLFGSMGHAATGVVGAAMARGEKAVAVVGDGSMLMNCELSSAAQYGVPAVWVVLNDAAYGMCRDGHGALGLESGKEAMGVPRVDFAAMARSVGADGVRVETEDMLEAAFDQAMAASGPFVIDVTIDEHEKSPLLARFESLIKQGSSKRTKPDNSAAAGGWEV
ncbi:MAG: thiamine pyrophosphate-dependent enzyme [Acidobacteriota bacterium]